jgi:hypothetical protein
VLIYHLILTLSRPAIISKFYIETSPLAVTNTAHCNVGVSGSMEKHSSQELDQSQAVDRQDDLASDVYKQVKQK